MQSLFQCSLYTLQIKNWDQNAKEQSSILNYDDRKDMTTSTVEPIIQLGLTKIMLNFMTTLTATNLNNTHFKSLKKKEKRDSGHCTIE